MFVTEPKIKNKPHFICKHYKKETTLEQRLYKKRNDTRATS